MGSKTTGSTTQNTQTSNSASLQPYGPAKPLIDNALGAAGTLFSQPLFGNNARAGITGTAATAQSAVPGLTQAFGELQRAMPTGPQANGYGALNDIQAQAYRRTNATSRGDQMGRGNPYLDQIINRSSGDISSQVARLSQGAGRYGSSDHAGMLAKGIGDMSSNLRYQDYGQQQARQDAATANLFNMGGAAQNNYQSGISNRLALAGGLSNAYDARQQPFADLLQIGMLPRNAGWQDINNLFNVAQGAGGTFGTQTANATSNTQGTTKQPRSIGSALGGALSGYDLTGSPWGGLIGGLGAFF